MAEKNEGGNEGTDETKAARKSAYALPDEAAGDATGDDEGSGGEATATLDGPIGEALRQSLRKFVVEKIVPEGQKGGAVDLNLDVDFLRQHGADLVSTLIQGIAKAVIPENLQVHLPLAQDDKAEADDDAEGSEEDVDVAVNFDFVNFLKGLITSPVPEGGEADAEGADAEGDDAEGDDAEGDDGESDDGESDDAEDSDASEADEESDETTT